MLNLKWNVLGNQLLKAVIGLSVPLLGIFLILGGIFPILGFEPSSVQYERMLMASIGVSFLLMLDVLNAKDFFSSLKIVFDRVMLVSLTVLVAWIAVLALQQGMWYQGIGFLALCILAFQMVLQSVNTLPESCVTL